MPIDPLFNRVLCVAEKPSIAKEISRILGQGNVRSSAIPGNVYVKNYSFSYSLSAHANNRPADFTVTSVLGHVNSCDFGPRWRKWSACEPGELFEAEIEESVGDKMKGVVTNLVRQARDHDLLLIWTDCDREGEHIGKEIMEHCRKGNARIRVMRCRFSAIIPAQIHNAAKNPVELDLLSAAAVETRQELDLRTGAAMTRLQTMALQASFPELANMVISYGPCQFPTLGFVVERYLEIQSFVPETFWFVAVSIEREEDTVTFSWSRHHLYDFEASVILYEQCVEHPTAEVLTVEKKPTKKWKPLPLTTVELQKAGSRLLHMSPKKVLEHAEKLYQKGFLSYPRTETDQYDKDFDFATLIGKQTQDPNWGPFAQRLQDGEFNAPRNGKKNDKAHPPIHPTAWTGTATGDEKRVYEFVVRRFLASCASDAEGRTTTVVIDIAGETFSTSGLVVLARNYLDVYPYDRWATSTIPDFHIGETFVPDVCELKEGQTTSPSLLTEADLVSLMDKNGIGTDATIAEHIAKIIEREYVMAQNQGNTKHLVPSNLGIALVEGWDKIGLDRSLCRPHLRRETEHRMQLICDGLQTKEDVLSESIQQYREVFNKARRDMRVLCRSVTKYLRELDEGQEEGPPRSRPPQGNAPQPRNGPGPQDLESDGDDDNPPAGRGAGAGRGGRGGGAAQARGDARANARRASPPVARAQRRAPAAPRQGGDDEEDIDEDEDDEDPYARTHPLARPAARQSTGAAAADAPQCRCNTPAVERTVTRETENKGRSFWTCVGGKDDGCGFFEWLDGPSGAAVPAKRPASAAQAARPAPAARRAQVFNDADGVGEGNDGPGPALKCGCRLTAVERTVAKEGPNKGRKFWTCPNSQAAQCGFFQWDDEADPGGGGARAGNARGGGGGQGGGGGGGAGAVGDCYKCHRPGHWAKDCPNEGNGGMSSRGGRGAGASSSSARGGTRGGRGLTRARGRGRSSSVSRGKSAPRGGVRKAAGSSARTAAAVKKEIKPKVERAVKAEKVQVKAERVVKTEKKVKAEKK